jgi:hypothetical protein
MPVMRRSELPAEVSARPVPSDERPGLDRPGPLLRRLPFHPAASAPISAALVLAPGEVFSRAPAPVIRMYDNVSPAWKLIALISVPASAAAADNIGQSARLRQSHKARAHRRTEDGVSKSHSCTPCLRRGWSSVGGADLFGLHPGFRLGAALKRISEHGNFGRGSRLLRASERSPAAAGKPPEPTRLHSSCANGSGHCG